MYKQIVIFISFCFILTFLVLIYPKKIQAKDIAILTSKGTVLYSLEVADTPNQQKKGLMWRKSMQKDQGMLFDFNQTKPVSMWMKNTYIPLDMLFIDSKGIIRNIHENAHPLDETIISCLIPVRYVIELNAGQVQENQIQIGNEVKDI